jgi:hypothetical protein
MLCIEEVGERIRIDPVCCNTTSVCTVFLFAEYNFVIIVKATTTAQ